jgi:ABC-type glycerol-3-phosphate transport system substrate-binding protein
MKRRFFSVSLLCASVIMIWGCGKQKGPEELSILLRMMPAQERYLRQDLIPKFEKLNNCKVSISTFDNEWDIPKFLTLEQGKKNSSIDLVKTPFEMTRSLVWQGYMQELTAIMDSESIMQDLAEYHQLAAALGYVDGKLYYTPRKLETRVLFYRKSMVADAVGKVGKYEKQIQASLKEMNGQGLPAGYALESDPAQWDWFDVFVIGSIWAHEEYNGVKMGRIAQRGASYGGTALTLVDKAMQLGTAEKEVMELTNDKCAEMLEWEHAFVKNGIYNPAMWQDKWKGSDIYNGIKDGKVFLTYLQQIDCFNVHGWADDAGMPGYLPNAEDMGLAAIPKAVSLELDKSGKPLVEGTRSISTGGWWWGIPKTSTHQKLAYKFARFISSRENQALECSKFGMIPVRKDILLNLPEVFEEGWVGDIFKTSVAQIQTNGLTTVPLVKQYPQISQLYVDAWYALCIEYNDKKDGAMDLSTMKMRLASDFSGKLEEILADKSAK